MLSTLVEDNQRNWDTLLPFVMMAHRCSENETTGMSPNMLMFGRETSTPLDILYEMPPSIKPISINQWVWELRGTNQLILLLEKNTGSAINRQKKSHDQKSNYQCFQANDNVYFPVKKSWSNVQVVVILGRSLPGDRKDFRRFV